MDAAKGEYWLRYLDSHDNPDHVVYAKFNFRIIYVEPLIPELQSTGSDEVVYSQRTRTERREIRMDGHLNSIDFYADEDMKTLIYEYIP